VVVYPDGNFSYTPEADYNGTDSFTYTITDVDGDVSTATVNLTIDPTNDVPIVENVTLHTDNLAGDWVSSMMPITLSADGSNTISWDLSSVPELFSNGEQVAVYYDPYTDKVIGETEISGILVFELSVDLNEGTEEEPSFIFKQYQELISGTTVELSDSVDLTGGNTPDGYGFALFDAEGNLLATAEATASGATHNTVNSTNNTMGVDNTFIDSGETLTIDYSVDSGSFTEGHGGNAVTYDFVASGVQSMLVTLDAFDSGETAVYTVYGQDADGMEVSSVFTVDGNDEGSLSFEIMAADIDAVYIDKVEFGAESGSYQLDFDAITTVSIDENASIPLGYTVTDVDGDFDSATMTIDVYGVGEEAGFVFEGSADSHDVFDMGEPGSTASISNYDIAADTLEVSDVIEDTSQQIASNTLREYFELTAVDSDNDGQVDDTQILIDSNGESVDGGDITTIYIQDTVLDEDDIDDMKVDYQKE
ncbi:Ig-like domain-containing protein, partial [Thiomicrorhabdus sp.]|uniref:Ig-like domain-containing protein n=1 Tax=Thiomicrorhabdus sp. TaxID=2039724 RepID=UPI003563572C